MQKIRSGEWTIGRRRPLSLVTMRTNEPTDGDLVAAARGGDREAFGLLYDRYARLVRAVAADQTTEPQDVADAVQEAFLRAYRNLHRLQNPDRFGPWIVGIMRQVARERRRSRRRDRHRFLGETTADVGFDPAVAAAVQTAEEVDLIMRRLAELPERERLAIHAFFLEDRDASRTAALLKLSRSGIYALIARALARLSTNLSAGPEED